MPPSPSPAAARRTRGRLDDAEIAGRLRLSATRLARRLRQESSTGLTPSQLSALAAVETRGPLTLGELADHERVAPPSITKVVAKLEADGFLERTPHPEDRRATIVRTTRAGTDLVEETRRRKTAWLAERIARLDDEERARLAAALDALDGLCREDAP